MRLRYHIACAVALGTIVGGAAGLNWPTQAQFTPEPSPTTTVPDGNVGTCRIEGISPVYDEGPNYGPAIHDTQVIAVDVFLRCAETTERTSLHQLHIDGVIADALQNLLELVVPATSQPVTPQ